MVKCVATVKSGATISAMSLARAWRRQLYGASIAALIVPSAMLAALVVLALGGGFNQVGVLGQIFAGPSAPGASSGSLGSGHAGAPAHSLPPLPVAALGASSPRPGTGHAGTGSRPGRAGAGPGSSHGPGQTGGAIGGAVPIVGGSAAPVPSQPGPTGSAPTQSSPPPAPSPQPQAQPQPRPTPVDRIVNTVTPVAQQLPAPVGPAATQAVQAAGSAADSVLPPGVGSGAPGTPPAALKLR
jgi:hypothetical protein